MKLNLIIGTVSAAGPGDLQENILVELIIQEVWELLENNPIAAESTVHREEHSGCVG